MNKQHDRAIVTAIQKMAGTHNTQTFTMSAGEVQSVDIINRTCEVLIENDVVLSCKLMATISDGLFIIPSVNSTVTVIYATYTDAFIISFSDVDSIVMKGGDLGGLVSIEPLVEKINNIEKLLNDFISIFNLHTHPGDGIVTATPETKSVNITNRLELENLTITHGS